MAVYRLYKMRSGKENKKADRRAATSSRAAKAPPAASTVAALPSPRQTATGTSFVASTSKARAQASVGQPHHGYAFGTTASAPGPSGWVMPAAANPTVQLQGAGHAGYMGRTGLPGLASGPATAANYPPASQQQQAADHFGYAGLAEWHKMLQMVPPPPPPLPPPAPPTASGPATAAHDLPTSQQQAAEHVGYPAHAGWNEQLLKIDLPPPLPAPAPAPAAEGYVSDEFNKWLDEVSKPAADPWFSMPGDDLPMLTDDEHQQCTFTFDELLGDMDDETAAASDTYRWLSGPAVQGSSQQDTSVAAN